MKRKTILILIAAVLLIGLVASGYLYHESKWEKAKASKEALEKAGQAAEKIIGSATQGALPSISPNPLESKPDVNPADKANPFKNIKTNPFE